jgi:choline dehydrogenase-like flavoprotein
MAGVVGPDFAVHGIDNLFAVDSSVFPTNTGVNPRRSIMGLAMHAANGIRDREARIPHHPHPSLTTYSSS